MNRLTAILIGLFISAGSIGQIHYKQSSISLSSQVQQFKFLDIHSSPLLYQTDFLPSLSLGYHHQTEKSFFCIRLTGSTGNINPERFGSRHYASAGNPLPDSLTVSSAFASVQFETAYVRKLRHTKNKNLSFWLGGQVKESAYYADEVANFPWLMNDLSISPFFKTMYSKKKNSFVVELGISALSLVSRETYALFPKSATDNNVVSFFKQGTRLSTIQAFQHLNFAANYIYTLSNRIQLGATYQLQWLHYNYPKRVQAADTRMGLLVNYIFHN
ncbi:MAG TPA: hypothetical protein VFS36_05520 [Chitinophagaceae bacterium]|nr:hypothetical protein [Chitinophagaceae bacterium]